MVTSFGSEIADPEALAQELADGKKVLGVCLENGHAYLQFDAFNSRRVFCTKCGVQIRLAD